MTQTQLNGIKETQDTSIDITEQLMFNPTPEMESLFALELEDFIDAVDNNQVSYKEALTSLYNLYTAALETQA